MKAVIGLIVALALFEFAKGSHIEQAEAAKEKCKGQHNVDEETIRQYLMEKKVPDSHNGKCFVACVMKELKALENGMPNTAVMKAGNKERYSDEAIIAKADQVIDICAKEVVPAGDECETAVQLVKCTITHGKEMGIPAPGQQQPHRR